MQYRDDQASLEARRDDLRLELAAMAAKAEALQALTRDREAAARELAAIEVRLAHRTARRLPLLDSVRIAAPCTASWAEMTGDDKVRFCAGCEKNVYNLSAMARDEAERLLAQNEGSLCVRLYQRADGTVMTNDCPVGVKRRRRRRTAIALAGAGAMAATAALAVGAMWTQGQAPMAVVVPPEPAVVPVMGSVAMPVDAPPAEPPAMNEYITMFMPMPPVVTAPKVASTAQPVRPRMGLPATNGGL